MVKIVSDITLKLKCIMPESPYCPLCKYGYEEILEGNNIYGEDTLWHCTYNPKSKEVKK